MDYLSTEPEFFRFLTFDESISKNTRTNYISWLRFLSKNYRIDEKLTENKIKEILLIENTLKDKRDFYTTSKDISNFKSSLRKYLKFISLDYLNKEINFVNEAFEYIKNSKNINETEKQNIILSRLGQGKFRKELINFWKGCSISMFDKSSILIASHIKPWNESNNFERLDLYNGLLLLPNYDKLFDRGYINFNRNGKIEISKFLNERDRKILNIDTKITIQNLKEEHFKYLDYHKEFCFIN